MHDPNIWIDPFGLKKDPHNALFEHQDANGHIKSSGHETSGGTGKKTPTWAEQAASHTEPKILNCLDTTPGDKVVIVGEKNPCNGNGKSLGKGGCEKFMKNFADTKGVAIDYHSLQDGHVYTFEPNQEPRVSDGHH